MNMSDQDPFIYLKYKNYDDLLKVILYSSQSMLGAVPLIYHINYNGQNVVFIQTGSIGGITIHYFLASEKPKKKFIELKRLTGDFAFVEKIGNDSMSIYIPMLELESVTLKFP